MTKDLPPCKARHLAIDPLATKPPPPPPPPEPLATPSTGPVPHPQVGGPRFSGDSGKMDVFFLRPQNIQNMRKMIPKMIKTT